MEKELMERSPQLIELDARDKVDLASAVPYYLQLHQHMELQIKSGIWKPGSKLPSEQLLCDHFKVSRTVVRQALNALTTSGLATTFKGKGSFVTQPKMALKLMQTLSGFYEDAIERGQKVNTRVLELDTVPAEEEIAQILHISTGDPVIKLHRLRFLDDVPVVVVTTYIPKRLCPELLQEDFTDQSLYRVLLEKFGLVVADGIRTIESMNATQPLAELLEVKKGAALSVLKSVGYLSNGEPLEYFISWHRGDRSRFQVRLTSREL